MLMHQVHQLLCQMYAVYMYVCIHRLDLTGGISVAPRTEPNFVELGWKHIASISNNEPRRHMLADDMIKCHQG